MDIGSTSAKTIDRRQEQVIQEFKALDDGMEKYMHLVGIARSAPTLDDAHRTDENLVGGCQAEMWLRGYVAAGKVHFEADSPSLIVKGVAALLIRVFSGQPPDSIVDAELWFIERIGLQDQFSPTRANGLSAMVQRMRDIAQAGVQQCSPAEGTGRSRS